MFVCRVLHQYPSINALLNSSSSSQIWFFALSCCMKIVLDILSLLGQFSRIAGINLDMSSSLQTSLVTVLFFQTSVPLGLFFDFCFAGSQTAIGQIPNFPSHQEFANGLK